MNSRRFMGRPFEAEDYIPSCWPLRVLLCGTANCPLEMSRWVTSGREQLQQGDPLFDHLVCAAKERERNYEAECFGSLEIDDQLNLG